MRTSILTRIEKYPSLTNRLSGDYHSTLNDGFGIDGQSRRLLNVRQPEVCVVQDVEAFHEHLQPA